MLGFIGLGDIGLPMARRVLATHGELIVWNRSLEKANELRDAGAKIALSSAEVMDAADVIGLCLTSELAVEEVATGPGGLLCARDPRGKVVVDFSTGAPDAAIRMAGRCAEVGAGWVDAPISGGVPAAERGELIVFAGGGADHIGQARPLLDAVAIRVSHMGPVSSGQKTKICNQMIVACNVLMIAEMIALGRKAGIDVERLPAALEGGFADSRPLQIFGPRMACHVFEPRLGRTSLMAKDLALAKAVAEASGARTPMLDHTFAAYASIIEKVLGPDADVCRLVTAYEDGAREGVSYRRCDA